MRETINTFAKVGLIIAIGCSFSSANVSSNVYPHKPWKLERANERIAKYRMGSVNLALELEGGERIPDGSNLKIEQTKHKFNFGASLTQLWGIAKEDTVDKYYRAVSDLFNYATVGFYWDWHEKQEGDWQFGMSMPDALTFAKNENMKIRGHALMWHNNLPNWIMNKKNDEELSAIVEKHVRDLVTKYPEIDEWDVYNEAPSIVKDYVANDNPGTRYLMHHGGLNQGVERIHNVALSAAPEGSFIANHHDIDDEDFHGLIQYLLKKKAKLSAIGLQAHMFQKDQIYEERGLWKRLERYAQYSVPIQLSEVTVLSSEHFEGWQDKQEWEREYEKSIRSDKFLYRPSSLDGQKYQADYIKDFYTLVFSHPSVEAIVYWDVSDFKFWGGSQGGLIDQNNNPKLSFFVLKDLIKNKWWTNKDVKVRDKKALLKGFLGSYDLKMKFGNDLYVGTLDIQDNDITNATVVLIKETGN